MNSLHIRTPFWFNVLLLFAALVGAAVIVWAGFVLAALSAFVVGAAWLGSWVRRLRARNRPSRKVPVTIEGEYTRQR